MPTKVEIVIASAESRMGDPYVFGAWGEECTPANRRKRIRSDHPTIVNKCPVLSDTSGKCACDGCPYQGRHIYDCRGFTYRCLLDAGIKISGEGATTQWETKSNWAERGTTDDMPDCVCCIFKDDGTGTKKHTGLHIGGGRVIHCSGEVKTGVIDKSWTHWAVPICLYSVIPEGRITILSVLKNGSKGDNVLELQANLKALGYDPGGIDGKFGAKTESAVRQFQADHGLIVDGVVGTQTWTALNQAAGHDPGAAEDIYAPAAPDEAEDEPGKADGAEYITVPKKDWNAIKAAVVAAYHVFRNDETTSVG